MIKKIVAFKASDQTIFEDRQKAELHETRLTFKRWYENNPLMDIYGEEVEYNAFHDWLVKNAPNIQNYTYFLNEGS